MRRRHKEKDTALSKLWGEEDAHPEMKWTRPNVEFSETRPELWGRGGGGGADPAR